MKLEDVLKGLAFVAPILVLIPVVMLVMMHYFAAIKWLFKATGL